MPLLALPALSRLPGNGPASEILTPPRKNSSATDGSSVTTERVRLFEQTEQLLRQRYRDEILRAPRALQALRRSGISLG